MNNRNESYNCSTIKERKIIIYLVLIFIILIYVSLFFIHNIIDVGIIKGAQLVRIDYLDNNKITDDDINNNIESNNISNNNGVNNNTINNENIVGQHTQQNQGTNSQNTGGNSEGNNGNGENNEIIVDNINRFRILEETQDWTNLKELSIFNNSYYQGRPMIAPGLKGKYNFTVENYTNTKVKYNMNFKEENNYNINMVYKLKLNNLYVAGNENKWVKYEDLCIKDLIINKHTSDLYTLEWKWEDNYNDTQIGETEGSNYKLKIRIDAEGEEQ